MAPDPNSTAHKDNTDASAVHETSLRYVFRDGLTSQAMGSLTTGVILVGLALELGASNLMIGMLAAVPFLSQFAQIPAIALIERVGRRRLVCAGAAVASRIALLTVAATPFLERDLAIIVLVAAIFLHTSLGAVAGCAWNSWMRDLVPENIFGRFFGRRLYYATALGIAAGLVAGIVIDAAAGKPGWSGPVFAGLFVFGSAIGLYGVFLIARIQDVPLLRQPKGHGILRQLATPFADHNFRRLLVFIASWNLAINLAAPFFTVYMLSRLGLAMSLVVVLTTVSQATNLVVLRTWGALSDRFSNKSVLAVAAPLFVLSILGWTFTGSPDPHELTLPLLVLLHIIMGIATAGTTLATGNIALKLSPTGKATAYLATHGVIAASAAAIGPIVGGALADTLAAYELSWTFTWRGPDQEVALTVLSISHWNFLFLVSFGLGLYSVHRLTLVEETGHVSERIILQELVMATRRSLNSLSSAAGLQRLTEFAFGVLTRPGKKLQPPRPVDTPSNDMKGAQRGRSE